VVGFDFMVQAVDMPNYYVIEAIERPGLASHEPQPTAQRFVDLLFPQTARVRSNAQRTLTRVQNRPGRGVRGSTPPRSDESAEQAAAESLRVVKETTG
jgi:hypothetical protein